jgi:hypothetical protein
MKTLTLAALVVLAMGSTAGAQEISADGRSVVGRATWLDVVVRVLDPDRLLIGLSGDELAILGERLYPEEGKLHNRAAHRLGSRILTDRYGAVGATALGIANEVFEAYNLRHTGHPLFSTARFDLGDVAANVRGVVDSYVYDLNSPHGLVWMIFRGIALARDVHGASSRLDRS